MMRGEGHRSRNDHLLGLCQGMGAVQWRLGTWTSAAAARTKRSLGSALLPGVLASTTGPAWRMLCASRTVERRQRRWSTHIIVRRCLRSYMRGALVYALLLLPQRAAGHMCVRYLLHIHVVVTS